MGLIKTYMIVANNALELPMKMDIRGIKEAADYLGISVQAARIRLHRDSWKGLPYKIRVDETAKYKPFDQKEYNRRYTITHDRRAYDRERYWKNREKRLAYGKAYRDRQKGKKQEEKNDIKRD